MLKSKYVLCVAFFIFSALAIAEPPQAEDGKGTYKAGTTQSASNVQHTDVKGADKVCPNCKQPLDAKTHSKLLVGGISAEGARAVAPEKKGSEPYYCAVVSYESKESGEYKFSKEVGFVKVDLADPLKVEEAVSKGAKRSDCIEGVDTKIVVKDDLDNFVYCIQRRGKGSIAVTAKRDGVPLPSATAQDDSNKKVEEGGDKKIVRSMVGLEVPAPKNPEEAGHNIECNPESSFKELIDESGFHFDPREPGEMIIMQQGFHFDPREPGATLTLVPNLGLLPLLRKRDNNSLSELSEIDKLKNWVQPNSVVEALLKSIKELKVGRNESKFGRKNPSLNTVDRYEEIMFKNMAEKMLKDSDLFHVGTMILSNSDLVKALKSMRRESPDEFNFLRAILAPEWNEMERALEEFRNTPPAKEKTEGKPNSTP